MPSKLLRIHGRVQGVGFRDAMRDEAKSHGITGWVRNRRDGAVEALIQGSSEQIDALLRWARRGPPAARVEKIECEESLEAEVYARFERFPTC